MSSNRDRTGNPLYGAVHKAERERWVLRVRAGGVCCRRCEKPIPAISKWDLGHVDEDGRRRGYPSRHPEHIACNRATLTHAKRKGGGAVSVPMPEPRFSRELVSLDSVEIERPEPPACEHSSP